MDYNVLSRDIYRVSETVNVADAFKEFIAEANNLLKEGWEPYGSLTSSFEVGEYGLIGSRIYQSFIKTDKHIISEYTIVRSDLNKSVTLLLYKGWKLYGNLVYVPSRGWNYPCQALIKQVPTGDLLGL
jgi:hypothetical protein